MFVKLLFFHIKGGHARVGKVVEAWKCRRLPSRAAHRILFPPPPSPVFSYGISELWKNQSRGTEGLPASVHHKVRAETQEDYTPSEEQEERKVREGKRGK